MGSRKPQTEEEIPVKQDDPAEGSRENVNVPFPEERKPPRRAPGAPADGVGDDGVPPRDDSVGHARRLS
jgi:hypothetical protein